MRRFYKAGWAFLLLCVLCAGTTAPAQAAFLTPNGNPTGDSVAWSPWYPPGVEAYRYQVSIFAAQYGVFEDDPAGLSMIGPALEAQGFSAANGWTITRFDLEGDLRLDRYFAWAESVPATTLRGFQYSHTAPRG
jgi:hypothetical protein